MSLKIGSYHATYWRNGNFQLRTILEMAHTQIYDYVMSMSLWRLPLSFGIVSNCEFPLEAQLTIYSLTT